MPLNINLLSDDTIARGITPPEYSKLPDAYWQGQDQAQKQALQNIFSGGLPKDPNDPTGRTIDWSKAMQMALQVQGAPGLPGALALRQADIQQQALRGLEQGAGGVFSTVPQPQPQTQFPLSAQRSGLRSVEPQQTSVVEPQDGGRTLRPDQPGNLGEVTGVSVDGQPTEAPTAPSFAPVASTDSRYPPEFGPASERFTQVAQAQQPQQQRPPPPPSQSPIPPGQPGYFSEENAARHDAIANRANYVAQTFDVGGLKAEGLLQQGKQAAERAKQIRDYLADQAKQSGYTGQTVPQFERTKKVQEAELARGDATYKGLSSQSNQYEQDLKPYLQQAKAIINDPSMYSGFGSDASLNWNKIRANFGDKQAALLQEALQKITAQSVLGTLNLQRDQMQQTGAQSGRIFSQQVDQVNKAVAGLPTTLPGNRYLVEMQMRLGEQSAKIYDLARDYVAKHGAIDAGFDNVMSTWLRKPENQPFTKNELSYPQLMGAPSVPPAMANNPAEIVRWGQALGVKPGEAIRFPNGKVQGFTLTPRLQ